MGEETKRKWEAKVVAEVAETDEEVVWAALEDFCNIHKWMPIDTCYRLEGVPGQPGLIRYCASNLEQTTLKWAKEKLLTIDPVQRSLSYEILDNNVGFKSYVATLKVLDGSKIEWGFVCDPVEGWTLQDLKSYVESSLHSIAKKIELAYSKHHAS